MSKVMLGKIKGDGGFGIDLNRLIETRMLIQANSGGGKSFLIRKVLEESHGKIQQIVLDVEGEFASLRQKYDYVLAGKGGDVAADPRTAELLARKLLELGADCIIDLYELKHHDRHRFMRLFLDSIMNAPKDLWHPLLVIVDEAHLFAPEKGQSEAMSAVIDLATRGRKREFAAILATQRISKLHKDAAAECLNKLIGRTGLDIDMKRASDELGFTHKEQTLSLRDFEPGEFFAFGPALTKKIQHVVIGDVQTAHGKAARKLLSRMPMPTGKVKQILAKLTDLPKEAEEELRDRESMKEKITELQRELKRREKSISPEEKKDIFNQGFLKGSAESAKPMIHLKNKLLSKIKELGALIESIPDGAVPTLSQKHFVPKLVQQPPRRSKPAQAVETSERTFGQCERKILGFLSLRPGEYFTKTQVGALTGYSSGSGGFNNAISNLSQAGIILRSGGSIALNPEADIADLVDATPHRLEDWISKLGACERAVYTILLEDPEKIYPKEEIAQIAGYSAGSGGFNNALSRLNTLGLLKRHPGGTVSANPEIINP